MGPPATENAQQRAKVEASTTPSPLDHAALASLHDGPAARDRRVGHGRRMLTSRRADEANRRDTIVLLAQIGRIAKDMDVVPQ
jgi:hypothetical protein